MHFKVIMYPTSQADNIRGGKPQVVNTIPSQQAATLEYCLQPYACPSSPLLHFDEQAMYPLNAQQRLQYKKMMSRNKTPEEPIDTRLWAVTILSTFCFNVQQCLQFQDVSDLGQVLKVES